jgi:hypothetical protein
MNRVVAAAIYGDTHILGWHCRHLRDDRQGYRRGVLGDQVALCAALQLTQKPVGDVVDTGCAVLATLTA